MLDLRRLAGPAVENRADHEDKGTHCAAIGFYRFIHFGLLGEAAEIPKIGDRTKDFKIIVVSAAVLGSPAFRPSRGFNSK